MAATYHHARRLYIGTTAERAAVVLDVDGIGTKYWDVTIDLLYVWNGTAWVGGFSSELLGEMLFTRADGLLLLGPDGEITPASWWTLRRQMATLSGAFRQEAGRWQGTRAPLVEPVGKNYIKNPSFEVNVTDDWALTNGVRTRDTTYYYVGSASCKLTADAAFNTILQSGVIAVADGETVTVQCRCLRLGSVTTGGIFIRDVTNGALRGGQLVAEIGTWEYLEVTWTNDTGLAANVAVRLYNTTADGASLLYFDAVQMEWDQDWATHYFDGAFGSGYVWDVPATPHNSYSTRTKTTVNLNNYANLLSSRNTFSIRIVAQMPFDADGDWVAAACQLVDVRAGVDNNNRIYVAYFDGTDDIAVYINGALRMDTAAQTFKRGDWLDIVVTFDFTADTYYLYINGVEVDSYSVALAPPAGLTLFYIGSNINAAQQSGYAIAEFAVFDRVLTADEVANLYALQRPLVDAGASDAPSPMMDGLYGYEEFGGFRYWEGMVIGGGETEVLPDAAGDAVYGVYAMCIATDRGVNTVQGTYQIDTPGAGSNTTGIYLALPDSVVLRLYSTGRLTIDEIAGVASIYVNLWLIWQ